MYIILPCYVLAHKSAWFALRLSARQRERDFSIMGGLFALYFGNNTSRNVAVSFSWSAQRVTALVSFYESINRRNWWPLRRRNKNLFYTHLDNENLVLVLIGVLGKEDVVVTSSVRVRNIEKIKISSKPEPSRVESVSNSQWWFVTGSVGLRHRRWANRSLSVSGSALAVEQHIAFQGSTYICMHVFLIFSRLFPMTLSQIN